MVMKESGFTIIELMLTLLVASVLVTLAAPGMKTFVQNGRITSATNDMVSSFSVARAEAIRQSAFTCVCSSIDANTPNPSCAMSNNWETGWIAFLDFNGNCVLEGGAPADVLLKVWDGTEHGAALTIRNVNVATNTVRFNARGETQQLNGRTQWGLFRICDDRGLVFSNGNSTTATAVVVSPSGKARSSRSASQLTACP